MEEIWKDIPGYEGLYQVSDHGNVRSLDWGRQGIVRNLYLKKHPCGYRQVELSRDGKKEMLTVHRLVATAFVPNPNNWPQVNHIDENKANNATTNLEWCTASYNAKYSINRFSGKRTKYAKTRIEQLSLEGELVKVWGGTLEIASNSNWSVSNILRCCRGERKTIYGFKWRFAI